MAARTPSADRKARPDANAQGEKGNGEARLAVKQTLGAAVIFLWWPAEPLPSLERLGTTLVE
jgi:hypothetical protein